MVFLRIGRLRSKRKFNTYPLVRNAKRIYLARDPEILQATVGIGPRGLPVRYTGPDRAAAAQVPVNKTSRHGPGISPGCNLGISVHMRRCQGLVADKLYDTTIVMQTRHQLSHDQLSGDQLALR